MGTIKNHPKKPLSSSTICETLAKMLGWENTPEWKVLERDLRAKLIRLEELEKITRRTRRYIALAAYDVLPK